MLRAPACRLPAFKDERVILLHLPGGLVERHEAGVFSGPLHDCSWRCSQHSMLSNIWNDGTSTREITYDRLNASIVFF